MVFVFRIHRACFLHSHLFSSWKIQIQIFFTTIYSNYPNHIIFQNGFPHTMAKPNDPKDKHNTYSTDNKNYPEKDTTENKDIIQPMLNFEDKIWLTSKIRSLRVPIVHLTRQTRSTVTGTINLRTILMASTLVSEDTMTRRQRQRQRQLQRQMQGLFLCLRTNTVVAVKLIANSGPIQKLDRLWTFQTIIHFSVACLIEIPEMTFARSPGVTWE